ncbi:hypothetical protein L1987_72726 [Smallanthus sonchifolius]|uniref:Uncharacterized protein n=1 Tax=Smallanthus sonchifolius TaxID=185202 RepID=A0ACB9AWQ6_9ASTR|nr:hypothetical protein L1987_72726 [Smallanthus sonchifolius]
MEIDVRIILQICKMRAIEQSAISRDTKAVCSYCNIVEKEDHQNKCEERIGDLLKILLIGRCSEWLKAYIMTAIVDFKRRVAPIGNIQDIGD